MGAVLYANPPNLILAIKHKDIPPPPKNHVKEISSCKNPILKLFTTLSYIKKKLKYPSISYSNN